MLFLRQPKIFAGILFFQAVFADHPGGLWAQTDPGADETYLLDDFEKASGWKVRSHSSESGITSLQFAALEISPRTAGRQYLQISFELERDSGLQILPERPFRIHGFVRQIQLFAYGSGRADDLFIDLLDRRGKRHREFLARLQFQGWQQVDYRPAAHISQRGPQLSGEPSGLTVLGFFLRPGDARPARLLLDDLSATVRPYFLQPETRLD